MAHSSLPYVLQALAALAAIVAIAACTVELRFSAPSRRVALVFAVVAGTLGALRLVTAAARNVRTPSPWDFGGFWIVGRAAVTHRDFYDPAVLARLAAPLDVTAIFRREIVDTGFWYPPATAFLMAPLGLAGERTALACWYALLAAALVTIVVLLRRAFFARAGAAGWIAAATLVGALPGTIEGIAFAQTAGLAFAMLLASLAFDARPRAGIWLGLAILVKPFVAVVFAVDLVAKRFARGAWTVGTLVATSLLAVVAFGPHTSVAFLVDRPAGRVPAWVYSEASNQSLWGVLLRHAPGSAHAIGAAIVTAVIVVTAVLAARASADDRALVVGAAVAAILLVYPVTQNFYGVFLALPLLAVWRERLRLPGGPTFALVVVAANVAAAAFTDGTFVASTIDWLAAATTLAASPQIALARERGATAA